MSQAPQQPNAPQKKQGLSAGAIVAIVLGSVGLVLLVIVIALAALLLPAIGRAREAASQARSTTQARAVALATIQYHSANAAMPGADTWQSDLVDGGWITRDKLDGWHRTPGKIVYFYVPQPVDGSTVGDASVVLVYQHPDMRAGGGSVAFADGSAEWIDEPAYAQLINALTLPDGTLYAPHAAITLPAD